ncbi:hypothetical protein RRG08_050039 [Elysia crispata]|uniref:Uncharacterized protein n=1 Tax=Elysia crispata TaxID=231223 RepID=A0AAE1EDN0_9GAST|nr:hypothetical protein RRG08_050039 [Elysia crispata]
MPEQRGTLIKFLCHIATRTKDVSESRGLFVAGRRKRYGNDEAETARGSWRFGMKTDDAGPSKPYVTTSQACRDGLDSSRSSSPLSRSQHVAS